LFFLDAISECIDYFQRLSGSDQVCPAVVFKSQLDTPFMEDKKFYCLDLI